MLTSKDLMIGDWVEMNSGPARIKTLKKGEIHFVDRFGYGIAPCCEGLPLTAEILEKNFEKKTFYGIYDDYFDFDIREYSDSIYVATFHNCEASFPDQSLTLSFVHELQHFLNHCGIEREIMI